MFKKFKKEIDIVASFLFIAAIFYTLYLEKKIVLPSIPVKIVRFLLGDMSELLLFDQKVSCDKLLKNGFTFKYVKLEDALKNLLHKL